jgi:hypothetical protein
MSLYRISWVAGLSLLCGFLLSACGADDRGAPAPPSLGEVKKFDPYRVYYAGKEVEGLPLEGVSKGSAGRWIYWGFGYGHCDPPSGFLAEGGCSLPLSVQNWSTCYRWAGKSAPKLRLLDFRGAEAIQSGNDSELTIFTGRTTVVIFAHGRNIAKSAARQLRTVGQAQPLDRLPPPVPGSLQGKLPCQAKRLKRVDPRPTPREVGREGLEPSTDGL